MRYKALLVFLILIILIAASSCRKDFEYTPSAGNLSFSKDTVYLDTVFSNIGSSTYTLKVYNDTRDDVIIPSISLQNGQSSFYRLNVDGVAGKEFTNVPLNAQDSLFIFIESTISIDDPAINELLYTDVLQFDSAPHQQNVNLVTLAKDAIFIFPNKVDNANQETITLTANADGNELIVNSFELDDAQLNFTNLKSYVIYGYATVPSGKELMIEPGSRVFFHSDSGLLIKENAKISAVGELSQNQESLEREIIFEGDRLEPQFENIPGQWGGIWFMDGSFGNTLNYSTIKNATIGLFIGENEPDNLANILLSNSQIYNSSLNNLWANNASITAENLVLGSAGSSSLNITNGGRYSFSHSTIANYWINGFRNQPALSIRSNNENTSGDGLILADFKNCIIDGNGQTELALITDEASLFNFTFENCLIKYSSNTTSPTYNFENQNNYINILINGQADFFSARENDFRISLSSEAIGLGNLEIANSIPLDLLGKSRNTNPDLGAYQAIEKPQ